MFWACWAMDRSPRFVRRYARLSEGIIAAAKAYKADVESRNYPSQAESYHMNDDQQQQFLNSLGPLRIPAGC